MQWLDIAWDQVGQQEVTGAGANPQIVAYFREVGRPDVTSDEVAWCAAGAGYCLQKAGVSMSAIPPAERLLARSYARIGTALQPSELRVGALAILSRGSNPAFGHVGFVVGWTARDVVLLGGNQADKFCTQHFSRNRIVALRWPGAAVTPRDVDNQGSRIAKAARQQQLDAGKAAGSQVIPAPPVPDVAAVPPVPDASVVAPVLPNAAVPDLPAPDVLAGKASALQSSVDTLTSFGSFAAAKWPWIMLVLGGYWAARILWNGQLIRRWRAEMATTGAAVIALPVVAGAGTGDLLGPKDVTTIGEAGDAVV